MFIQVHERKITDMVKEITDRVIPGVTIKQVITIISATAIFCLMYFNLRQTTKQALEQSLQNSKTLDVILGNQKEAEKINSLRMANIELDQREAKIRLGILERTLSKQ